MRRPDTYLRLDEKLTADWGPLDLSDDPECARRFWTVVLQYAIADGGEAVHFRLDRGDDCLGIEIAGTTHFMVPPPVEYRTSLLRAARHLAAGDLLTMTVRTIVAKFRPSAALGRIYVEIPGAVVEWAVRDFLDGVCFKRNTEFATIASESRQ
jgi:hypothetical protein